MQTYIHLLILRCKTLVGSTQTLELHPVDVMAVQFQELGLDQLCRVIVPGNPDGLAVGTDRFQQDVHDLVQLFPVYPGILGEGVILDVL